MFRRASVDISSSPAAAADAAAGAASPALLSRSSSMEQQHGAWAGGGGQAPLDGQAARALARFTVQVNPRHRGPAGSAGSAAELGLAAASGSGGGGSGGGDFGQRSSSVQVQGVVAEPLSPRQQQQRRDEDVQRTLRTMSLIPRRPNTEMARVWEGIPQQQQQQPWLPATDPAGGAGQQLLSPRQSAQQQQQQQWPPAPVGKLSGLGYEEGSRLYSDEEVQAVAAALPAPLSVQQQRLLADLLRLKRVRLRA